MASKGVRERRRGTGTPEEVPGGGAVALDEPATDGGPAEGRAEGGPTDQGPPADGEAGAEGQAATQVGDAGTRPAAREAVAAAETPAPASQRAPVEEAGDEPPPVPARERLAAQAAAQAAAPARLGKGGTFGLVLLVPGVLAVIVMLILRVTSLVQALLLAIPVLLLGAGLERVGKAVRVRSLRTTGAVVVVLALGGPVVLWATPTATPVDIRAGSPVPDGVAEARLQASLVSGQLRVTPGGSGLFEADLRSSGRSTAPVSTTEGLAVVDLDAPQQRGLLARNRGSDWDVALSTGLPWQVHLDAGAVTADLDLTQLNMTSVDVDAGPSRLALRLGQPGARTPVDVRVDAGTVDLYLPRDAGLELEVTGKVLRDFGDRDLAREGAVWRSGAAGQPAYLIRVHIGVGRLRLHWR